MNNKSVMETKTAQKIGLILCIMCVFLKSAVAPATVAVQVVAPAPVVLSTPPAPSAPSTSTPSPSSSTCSTPPASIISSSPVAAVASLIDCPSLALEDITDEMVVKAKFVNAMDGSELELEKIFKFKLESLNLTLTQLKKEMIYALLRRNGGRYIRRGGTELTLAALGDKNHLIEQLKAGTPTLIKVTMSQEDLSSSILSSLHDIKKMEIDSTINITAFLKYSPWAGCYSEYNLYYLEQNLKGSSKERIYLNFPLHPKIIPNDLKILTPIEVMIEIRKDLESFDDNRQWFTVLINPNIEHWSEEVVGIALADLEKALDPTIVVNSNVLSSTLTAPKGSKYQHPEFLREFIRDTMKRIFDKDQAKRIRDEDLSKLDRPRSRELINAFMAWCNEEKTIQVTDEGNGEYLVTINFPKVMPAVAADTNNLGQ